MNPAMNQSTVTKKGPIPGTDGNWECRHCKNVNFPQREKCNRCGEPGGNWTCPQCANLNYAHRDQCNRCDMRRPGLMRGMPVVDELARALVQCFAGEAQPTQAAIRYLMHMNAANPMWARYDIGAGMGGGYGGGYGGGDAYGRRSGKPAGPPRNGVDGNWKCSDETCGNINFPHRTHCNLCSKARE